MFPPLPVRKKLVSKKPDFSFFLSVSVGKLVFFCTSLIISPFSLPRCKTTIFYHFKSLVSPRTDL
ncbi:hypothetical protein HanXRQr2_Chr07g0281891 [Helianthus annuus]|uniref:Uncharacterized protein n=1 Tax=Helianthus annuus TaxID=4232 RepID=A0A9K3NEC2_HELAN|nr:hypothetical protein HanXRQr2_Chr07g0281891 [Helianthus annuus]